MSLYGKVRKTMASNVVAFNPESKASPKPLNGKVPPRRVPNADVRTREYLTADEVNDMLSAASKVGRHGHRV